MILVGESIVKEREKSFGEVQDMKKTLVQLKDDVARMKEILKRLAEQIESSARREELMILQRQMDLFRSE
jgi:adenine C2-methylase RlmN of 23S rRNA A2503 and tRNA A37